jgi:broad specificity phosphatase PhoE
MPLFPHYRVASSRDDLFRANKPFKQLTKIILVRHGRTDYNEKHWGDAEGKGRLTDYGHKQAQAIAEKYATTDIDAIYCSPLMRCQQTISYLADTLNKEIVIDKRLTECQAFAVQDKPFDCSTIQRGYNRPIDGVS